MRKELKEFYILKTQNHLKLNVVFCFVSRWLLHDRAGEEAAAPDLPQHEPLPLDLAEREVQLRPRHRGVMGLAPQGHGSGKVEGTKRE